MTDNKRISCRCEICGEEITGTVYEFEGTTMCEDCYSEHTFKCEECGERHWESESHWVEDEMICYYCYVNETFCCEECNATLLRRSDAGDSRFSLCEDCRDNYYVSCEDCDCLIREDNAWYQNGNPFCRECYDEKREPDYIHSYNYKPEPKFRGFTENYRYFGVELEIALGGEDEENAEEFLQILNGDTSSEVNAYIKHDSSLENGMEIVSQPATLNYHKTMINWEEFMKRAIHRGYRSHKSDCCGLHVHVSRDTFGDDSDIQNQNIAKLIYFVEKFWAEMFRFSRRTEYTIQRWASRYGYEKTAEEVYEKARNYGDRYKNINLCNRSTIEFRFFRGTLKYNTFIATLQLVNEICNVAITLSQKDIDKLSWSEFALHIDQVKNPELIQYLKECRIYINDMIESEEY